jgi:hypothetical protein
MKITVLLLGVGVLVLLACSVDAQEKNAGKGIDLATVTAFRKAGWAYGGWVRNNEGVLVFRVGNLAARHGFPGFLLTTSRYDARNKPPEVGVPFGLLLNNLDETRLKEFAGVKNLAMLDFDRTPPNLIKLKELTNLKDLTTIVLRDWRLSDEFVRTLAEIKLVHLLECATASDGSRPKSAKEIVTLDLRRSAVTAAALKHLADLSNLTTLRLDKNRLSDEVLTSLRQICLLHSLPQATAKDGGRPKKAEEVASLDLREFRITGDGVKELGNLKNLESLKLTPGQVSDEVLEALRRFKLRHTLLQARAKGGARPKAEDDIDEFFLHQSRVTPAGLKELAGLKNIRMICLDRPKATDEALCAMREAGVLHTLRADLPGPPGPNAGRSAEDVREFRLDGTPVTDAGLKELVDFKNLRSLHLNRTKVTNNGLKELRKFERLELLYLNDTDVTEDAIKDIVAIKGLRHVSLNNTYFTRGGLAQIRQALPRCNVFPAENQPLTTKKAP